jgi:hypothetical protein
MTRVAVLTLALAAPFASAQTPAPRPAAAQPKIVEPTKAVKASVAMKLDHLKAELLAVAEHPQFADAAVYAKAAEWMLRHGEWYGARAGEQTLAVLDSGLRRAEELKANPDVPSWLTVRGKPIVRGYVSNVDGSVQPYALTVPEGYDPKRDDNRLDVVLAGRSGTKTEVNFIYSRETAKAATPGDRLIVEPYARGNNAYRWAGETDVFDAIAAPRDGIKRGELPRGYFPYDTNRVVLRGFSMGGAGTWHLGLHYPERFAAISPGAGFTVTKGYAKDLPNPLPDYVEKCLRIYDAADYAENVFNVPVVAYSGERDGQIAAARNVEARLKDHPYVKPFTHLIAPGLEHKQPPEWLARIDEALTKHLPRETSRDIRFVTYTSRYGEADWVRVLALEKLYERAEVIAKLRGGNPTVTTKNVRFLELIPASPNATSLSVDGQSFAWPRNDENETGPALLVRRNESWRTVTWDQVKAVTAQRPAKRAGLQGPIDDAFTRRFTVVAPAGVPTHKDMGVFAGASLKQFGEEWDKWMRGKLPTGDGDPGERTGHLVLFGDPGCNGKIAEVLPRLPITWTEKELIVNNVAYDPKTHIPVLIYPNPFDPERYVVINSGHTFHEADFKGTNALLFPRLGDWAVLRPTPTADDPTKAVVVAAGLFDENWQFARK